MKYNLKKDKGVTMVALVITVLMILILTNMLIYNAQDDIYIKRLTNLYNDISVLREKVSTYYDEYGKIPAEIKYTNTNGLSSVLSTNDDREKFYIIDLEAMQGITLNYGKDYEKVKDDKEHANDYTNLYIINENSHNIFYVEGVEIKENNTTKKYYTDYTEPDQTTVDLRYINGILIPNGYYYIGKTINDNGNESIVISDKQESVDVSKENQYIWIKQVATLEKTPDSVKLDLDSNQKEYQFLKSVNTYKGYFKNSKGKVQYISINEDKWSEAYTSDIEYEDRNGDKITIPEGFKVSMAPTMNVVEKGFVVKDSKDNEWVWVVVPDSAFATAINNSDYENIKADLIRYTKDYRNKSGLQQMIEYNDEWYEGCGIKDKETYTELYNKMLSSIYTNKGFWISRYEAGISGSDIDVTKARTSHTDIASSSAVSKEKMIPYNYVTCGEAQELASAMCTNTNKKSSLLFGIQWDLVCKFLEEESDLNAEDINTDSASWGNYATTEIENIKIGNKQLISSEWKDTNNNKPANSNILLTTGASEQTKKLNIYDLAGNEWEWTLEQITNTIYHSCGRGGYYYYYNGENYPASYRGFNDPKYSDQGIGFRIALY